MKDLELAAGFLATPERFLWHEENATAIVADLHLGAEAELTRRGIFMPDVSTSALRTAWALMCERIKNTHRPGRVIIAGDLFDTPTPDPQAQSLAVELIESLQPIETDVTLLIGNHDPTPDILRQIFQKLPVHIDITTKVGPYTVTHGHQAPDPHTKHGGFIVGHQHPAVVLQDKIQSAKMICYAVCKLPRTATPLIVLPSFSRAPLGSNLLTEHHWILEFPRPADADVRIAGIVDHPAKPHEGQVLDFGPLSGLRLPF